MKTAGI
jgi:hypothetical protein